MIDRLRALFGLTTREERARKAKEEAHRTFKERKISYSPPPLRHSVEVQRAEEPSSNFGLSMAVGMATHNPVLGGLVGGDFVGGFLGAEISEASTPSL